MARTSIHTVYKLADGTKVPSVTTVLNILAKPALIEWAYQCGVKGLDYRKVRDQAADIGTIAHYLIQCDIKGVDPELGQYAKDDIDKAENAYLAWLDWRKVNNVVLLDSELQLVSERYRYGGTIDFVGLSGDVIWLIDFKTGRMDRPLYPEYIYQIAAYQELWNHNHPHMEPIDRISILRLGREDGSFEEHRVGDTSKAFLIFQHALDIYRLTH